MTQNVNRPLNLLQDISATEITLNNIKKTEWDIFSTYDEILAGAINTTLVSPSGLQIKINDHNVSNRHRLITANQTPPTGGSNGDIWLIYED